MMRFIIEFLGGRHFTSYGSLDGVGFVVDGVQW
jgi:hypothetical protein